MNERQKEMDWGLPLHPDGPELGLTDSHICGSPGLVAVWTVITWFSLWGWKMLDILLLCSSNSPLPVWSICGGNANLANIRETCHLLCVNLNSTCPQFMWSDYFWQCFVTFELWLTECTVYDLLIQNWRCIILKCWSCIRTGHWMFVEEYKEIKNVRT